MPCAAAGGARRRASSWFTMTKETIKKTTITPAKAAPKSVAAEGDVVIVHYTGTLDSGEEFDTSVGRDPIEFVLGEHNVIPGFERAITGMKPGEKKRISIPPAEAYGEPDMQLRQAVPRAALGSVTPEVGMQLAVQHPAFPQPLPVKIVEVTDETVTLDMNHPLAGQTLHFDLELVEIR